MSGAVAGETDALDFPPDHLLLARSDPQRDHEFPSSRAGPAYQANGRGFSRARKANCVRVRQPRTQGDQI